MGIPQMTGQADKSKEFVRFVEIIHFLTLSVDFGP
jgi:hypothetical protein